MDSNSEKQVPVVDPLGSDTEFDKDEQLVDWLAIGYTHERAGAEVGLSAKSVQRRLTPEFKERVALKKRELHAKTWETTFALRERAVSRLESLVCSENERVAMGAIRLVFDISGRIRGEQAYQDLSDEVLELNSKVDSANDAIEAQERDLEARERAVKQREKDVAELERERTM